MSAKIETPAEMALRLTPDADPNSDAACARVGALCLAIRARDEQIAAWCEEKAGAAQREADGHDKQRVSAYDLGDLVTVRSKEDRIQRCEGQASALRSLAAILRGSPA